MKERVSVTAHRISSIPLRSSSYSSLVCRMRQHISRIYVCIPHVKIHCLDYVISNTIIIRLYYSKFYILRRNCTCIVQSNLNHYRWVCISAHNYNYASSPTHYTAEHGRKQVRRALAVGVVRLHGRNGSLAARLPSHVARSLYGKE